MKLTWLRDKLLRSSRPFCVAVLFVLCSKLILFCLVEGDECRQIEFGDALSNSRLSTDHVIRVYHVQNEPSCRVKCFLEPDCVAYNYGKNNEGNLQCEFCNTSHLQVPSNHVMITPGFLFRPVAENPCITNPCPYNFTCQVGFRDQGYRCVSACNRSLGMESGKILDKQITASSKWNANHAAHQGRPNFQEVVEVGVARKSGSWSARKNDKNQWLQVNLLREESVVTSVATQGRNRYPLWKAHHQWVKNYKLLYSNDEVNFEYYKDERQNSVKEFTGNTDENGIVFHDLNPPIRARYVRFRPTAWRHHLSMRVELYGRCDSLSVIVCEGKTKEIRCKSRSKICVLWANYGRLNPKTSPHSSIKTSNCRASTSLNNVRNICQGKTACTLAPNYGSLGVYPCGGTYKYLLVGYKCDN